MDVILHFAPAPGDELAALSGQALERVLGPNSELADLLDESGSASWRASIAERSAWRLFADHRVGAVT
jgi:predicted secreted protein